MYKEKEGESRLSLVYFCTTWSEYFIQKGHDLNNFQK